MNSQATPGRVRALPKRLLGYLYVWSLYLRSEVRTVLDRGGVVLLGGTALVLVIEVTLELWGKRLALHPANWVRIVFWGGATLVAYTKIREWRDHQQGFAFVESVRRVVDLLIDSMSHSLRESAESILEAAVSSFPKRGRIRATIALAKEDETLVVAMCSAREDESLIGMTFATTEGCLGKSYTDRVIVYVPRVSFGHAILQGLDDPSSWTLLDDAFAPRESDSFKSLLTVPLVVDGQCYGTLSLVSERANAFQRLDRLEAYFFGFSLAHALQAEARRLGL